MAMSSKGRKPKQQTLVTDVANDKEDFPTPDWCVHRLLDRVHLPRGRWLEPCAGYGSIIEAVNQRQGRSAPDWTACELQDKYRLPLQSLARNVYMGDFLGTTATDPGMRFTRGEFDVALTNTPFTLAVPFMQHMRVLAPVVAMLLRLNWLGSDWRQPLLVDDMPHEIYVLPNRPSFVKGRTDSCEYGWMVYRGTHKQNYSRTYLLGTTPREVRMATRDRDAARRAAEGW